MVISRFSELKYIYTYFNNRLIDIYVSEWYKDINNRPSLFVYRHLKEDFSSESNESTHPYSLLGKTWSGQVDHPSLSNCRTSAKWQADK